MHWHATRTSYRVYTLKEIASYCVTIYWRGSQKMSGSITGYCLKLTRSQGVFSQEGSSI